ncbi:MAG: tRNA (adenosine(37)-N6)-threonylcarbamoyltransferase complex dimerization subunit type 1 TsaB [Paracoccus sp. (in: a-proteobacteria)]|uniref:tRNA (adenosine(37)-N6)-threonylcarbamoyltransferase complex dimerization subunit type 1 TsaB n=1 Tax=Paracoccus sp. TaxID=267 RepID=UPI0026DEBE8B|nr:tRNA (adenosine(37)-N6)-threonylcarbamoyltransferase complex dimerization subunit type 1 TsaB [Paracoccus sp. (in: a-proteobacteria)]MDO5620451.1 tRNA (adenosine(37)-N6)-threonylcarbamoyltransferase complex dimerization subunit type 1 TsaB [Paracoccus sp. (in: a-proteobacteria)]
MAELTLGFDTSAAHCAAALLSGETLLASVHEDMTKGQAERLFPLLESLLTGAGAGWRDLSVIGVGIGPGNFTGIRISVAAARGLALSLDVPAIGVSGFEALRLGQPPGTVASIDARQDRLYVQAAGAPVLCDIDSLPELPPGAACIGHRAAELAARCGGYVATPALPLAEAIARIALSRRMAPGPAPAPLYLRAADAAPARERGPVMLS